MSVVTPKPLNLFDKKGTTAAGSWEDASKQMQERVAGTIKPRPATGIGAAQAERAASIELSKKMQSAPTIAEATQIRRDAEEVRLKSPPPASPDRQATPGPPENAPARQVTRAPEKQGKK